MGKNDLEWLGFSIDISAKKCGSFEVQLRFAPEKLQMLLKLENPTLNQFQSADGSIQLVSRMPAPVCVLFLSACTFFLKAKKVSQRTGGK